MRFLAEQGFVTRPPSTGAAHHAMMAPTNLHPESLVAWLPWLIVLVVVIICEKERGSYKTNNAASSVVVCVDGLGPRTACLFCCDYWIRRGSGGEISRSIVETSHSQGLTILDWSETWVVVLMSRRSWRWQETPEASHQCLSAGEWLRRHSLVPFLAMRSNTSSGLSDCAIGSLAWGSSLCVVIVVVVVAHHPSSSVLCLCVNCVICVILWSFVFSNFKFDKKSSHWSPVELYSTCSMERWPCSLLVALETCRTLQHMQYWALALLYAGVEQRNALFNILSRTVFSEYVLFRALL